MTWITSEMRGALFGGEPERRQISKSSPLEMIQPHRYTLWRRFEENAPLSRMPAFIGLNPSTATPEKLDPTVSKCEYWAQQWGFDGFVMLNLFSYRATEPQDMLSHADPTGDPDNAAAISWVCNQAGLVVACWGNDGSHLQRSAKIRAALEDLDVWCLHINKTGEPKHPLYHKKAVLLEDLVPLPPIR